MVRQLETVADRLILTEFSGPRARCATDLAQLVARRHEVCSSLSDAIRLGMDSASIATPLLITGSIFAAGQARKILIDEYGAAPLRF